jgi:5-methylthioadenosine/S-adenosylhomocysteine deaminase
VDPISLRWFAERSQPLSVHVAESVYERQWLAEQKGPLFELHAAMSHVQPKARSSVDYLSGLGLCRPGVQWVHCCDLDEEDIAAMASGGVSVAHCPRSNQALGCPVAPIRRLRQAGVQVGIGTDSAASAGAPDMFAEMRVALALSREIGEPLTAEEVWCMATTEGALSVEKVGWRIEPGAALPLIALNLPDARCTEDLIAEGCPEAVSWVFSNDEP